MSERQLRADRLWTALGLVLVAAACLHEVSNPDVFWHLSVGRQIAATGSLPAVETFSHTKAGAPWREYEWLTDLLWLAAERRAGALGLIALKTALLTGAAACVAAALALQRWSGRVRCLAVVALAACWGLVNDARPDNFSIFFFAAELLALEAARDGRLGARAGWLLVPAFAVWANLHPGFAYGLAIAGLYDLDAVVARSGRGRVFAVWLVAAALGACVNPLGPKLLLVLAEHGRHAAEISRRIEEWRPPALGSVRCAPFWALLAAAAAVLVFHRRRTGRFDLLLWGLCGGTAAWALAAQRAIPYFALAAIVAAGRALREAAGPDAERRLPAWPAAAALAVMLSFFAPHPPRVSGSGWDLSRFPVEAATYLDRHAGELSALPLYNPLQWGGYLALRLWPRYLIYMDGRSAFLDMMGSDELALDVSPERWQAILDRRGIRLALMTRAFPDVDGRRYDLAFMPRERWELLHEDPVALLFRRREPRAP